MRGTPDAARARRNHLAMWPHQVFVLTATGIGFTTLSDPLLSDFNENKLTPLWRSGEAITQQIG